MSEYIEEATELLSEREVSEMLGVSPALLRRWRSEKIQLPFLKLGKTIRYKLADVEDMIEACTVAVDRTNPQENF